MGWTTPRDWATDELVTEAMMDTHVKDNLNHLKDTKQDKITTYSWTNTSVESHTGNTTPKAFGVGQAVTTTVTSTVVIAASFSGASSLYAQPVWFQIYRNTTALGVPVSVITERNKQWDGVALIAVDASLAAGSYTYYIKYWPSSSGYTAHIDQGTMAVIVMAD